MWAFHYSSGDVRPLNFQWYVVVPSDIFGINDCYFCCAQLGPNNPPSKAQLAPSSSLAVLKLHHGAQEPTPERSPEGVKQKFRAELQGFWLTGMCHKLMGTSINLC